jgi:hypothetical protein
VLFYSCAMYLIGADGRIKTTSDYQHREWVLTAGSVVVRESLAEGFLSCPTDGGAGYASFNGVRSSSSLCGAAIMALGQNARGRWQSPMRGRSYGSRCMPRSQSYVSPLCWLPAFICCGLILVLQKNPESDSVRNQQQGHYQSRKEECGSQLSRQ